ncbi:MAG: sulfite exporter TauE/SafE family protein [Ignavibacteria bacterium]|nr:sulfite exporter TauE/SafE family protein [Ignavibacteria bacterium]
MDENFRDRMGWKEVCVRSICGETIQATTVPQTDITDELRNYPADRLTNPLNVSEASIQYLPGTAKPTASSFAQSVVEKTKDGFAELISAKEISPSVMVISLLIAMMLGAGHALTPGHGKTIVAAYLVGQRGTAKHAAFLGLTVTATHTIGVFAMGLIALFASQYVLPENLFPWLGSLSGLIVLFIGLSLLLKRIRYARGMLTHTHDGHTHSHDHHEPSHEHSHGGHTHSHLPSGADGAPVTWKSLLALGVSGGLLPCPSAIVVLLSAVALGRIGFGLLLIIAFSIGLAGVLTGIGLLMVYARKFFERFSISGPLARWLPVMSAFIVTIAGAIITVQAVGQTGIRFDGSFLSNSLSLQSMFSAGALSILGLGFILGLKHALDADHLVAVSTIVSERKGFWSSSLVGAFWGLGHTASLLVVGLIVIAFNVQIPEKIAQGMEFTVALMLIVLGTNVLRKLRRGATMHFHIHKHQHHIHMHPHLHESVDLHRHGDRVVHHHHVKIGKKPFLVGMVHGMAGSAALMLLVLATISSRPLALLYIAIFGIGSVGGMFLMSMLIGLPFSFTSNHERLNNIVRMSAGIISLCFGLFYAWQVGIVDRLFL